MFERRRSRPLQTAFVALLTEVSWLLRVDTSASCSRIPASAAETAAASISTSCSRSVAAREQPRQAHGRFERGRVRGERVDDAIDVAGPDVERGDARRGMQGREDDQPDDRAAVRLGLAELVADGPARHRPVLGLDHDPQVGAACRARR